MHTPTDTFTPTDIGITAPKLSVLNDKSHMVEQVFR